MNDKNRRAGVYLPPHKTQINSRENPRRGFSLFPCFARQFTLSCVLGRIGEFRSLRRATRAPRPWLSHLLKKVDENFQAGVCALIGRTQKFGKKINPQLQSSWKLGGVGGRKASFKKVSSPHEKNIKTKKLQRGRTPDEGSPSFFAQQRNSPSPAF